VVTLAPGAGAVLVKVPVATPTPTPPVEVGPPAAAPTSGPAKPRRPVRRSSGKTAHTAGAEAPNDTKTTVGLTRAKVFGRVAGAVSGYTRVTVRRKRGGRWVTVRTAKDSVSKRGRYAGQIKPLPHGTYRVVASFEGTGTARPSRAKRTKRL
jgi:hypothetical protein